MAFSKCLLFEVDRSLLCHAWGRPPSQGALLMPLPHQPGSEALESLGTFKGLHLLMSSVLSICLCNFLSLEKTRLEVPLLVMLLCRCPGLSSSRTYVKYEHIQDLATCLSDILVMPIFHRSSVLLKHLAQLKKPKTH